MSWFLAYPSWNRRMFSIAGAEAAVISIDPGQVPV